MMVGSETRCSTILLLVKYNTPNSWIRKSKCRSFKIIILSYKHPDEVVKILPPLGSTYYYCTIPKRKMRWGYWNQVKIYNSDWHWWKSQVRHRREHSIWEKAAVCLSLNNVEFLIAGAAETSFQIKTNCNIPRSSYSAETH